MASPGPLKLAIIGGGPSAFYLTSRLIQLLRDNAHANDMRIHVYDRLWAPYGLVRYGVAPDHPEVKNCTHKFDAAASDPRVRFFGNVNVGVHPAPFPGPSQNAKCPPRPHALPLPLHALFPYYTHLVFATGAPRPRLHPLLPRSNLCIPALDIVHWYTMHPSSKLSSPIPPGTRHITIIGHGNVSLDIARMLLTPPSRLASLDIPAGVLRALEQTWRTLRHITIIGRRGPRDVRFTAKELREMMHLEDAVMYAIPEAIMNVADEDKVTRQQERLMKLLREGSRSGAGFRGGGSGKTFSFEFWQSPTGYTIPPACCQDAHVVLQLEKMEVDGVTGKVVGTGKREDVRTDLVVTSLGYEGDPAVVGGEPDVDGQTRLPWYDGSTGQMRVEGRGQVFGPDGRAVRNVYATGWAARGARGVLGDTLMDAYSAAAGIVEKWGKGRQRHGLLAHAENVAGGLDGVPPEVRTGPVVNYETWQKVEEEERRRGGGVKERERMAWSDVHQYLNQG